MIRILMSAWLVVATFGAPSAALAAEGLSLEPKRLEARGGGPIEAEHGRLVVPENRRKPGSRKIEIRFLRLKSRAKAPAAPVFYLDGGPGSRPVTENPGRLAAWWPTLEVADVVLIDQRGTDDSLLVWRSSEPPPREYFVSADVARARWEAMDRAAAEAFRARGVDLSGYTTVESADDVEALRVALGYPRISLIGFSYGTHLAIAYLRKHGARVENAVLAGVEGPDQTEKLPLTFDAQFAKLSLLAAADPALGGRLPDLVALYDRVAAKLDRTPVVIPVEGRGRVHEIPVGGFGLRLLMRYDIGDATDLPVFPRMLWSLDRGDTTELAWFLRKRVGAGLGVHGMNRGMDFASGISPGRAALIADQAKTSRFADVVNFPPARGEDLGLVPLPDSYRAPLVSNVRTLILSGTLDFNTPPAQAEELRWGMSNATHLVVENAGHEQTLTQNEEAARVVLDFLKGMDVRERKLRWPSLSFVPLEGPPGANAHPAAGAR